MHASGFALFLLRTVFSCGQQQIRSILTGESKIDTYFKFSFLEVQGTSSSFVETVSFFAHYGCFMYCI